MTYRKWTFGADCEVSEEVVRFSRDFTESVTIPTATNALKQPMLTYRHKSGMTRAGTIRIAASCREPFGSLSSPLRTRIATTIANSTSTHRENCSGQAVAKPAAPKPAAVARSGLRRRTIQREAPANGLGLACFS